MKIFRLIVLLVGTAVPVMAQTLPSADVDTVRSGIGEENLAPLPSKPKPVTAVVGAVSGSAPVSNAVVTSAAVVSDSGVVDPFVVKGVVATLSGTTGFDREAALEVAARQALPVVLERLAIPADKATKTVKGLGSAMRFVKSYKVVKETLIPSYVLTTDMSFNGAMVQKNFGGKLPEVAPVAVNGAVQGVVMKVSGTAGLPVDTVEVAIPAAANTPVKQWVVRISERDPAQVDKVRANLNRQANTRATYRLLTSAGAELLVDTPLGADEISNYAGHSVEVVELEIPLPTGGPLPLGNLPGGEHPWQGQAEQGAPNAPGSPNAPSAPSSPAGVY